MFGVAPNAHAPHQSIVAAGRHCIMHTLALVHPAMSVS